MPTPIYFRRTVLAALLGAAALTVAAPHAAAQSHVAINQIEKRAAADAQAAAQRGLAQFAAHHLRNYAGNIGDFPLQINNVQELKDAKIAYGFPVHTIDPADLMAGRSTMRAMARKMDQWRFVIDINGRAVGLATVEKNKGRYETVAYGAAVLAKDLHLAARQFGNADKSNLRFLRIYQARSDFLEVDSVDGRGRFTPLHSARASLSLREGAVSMGQPQATLLDESELVQPLRMLVKQNLAAPL